MATCDVCSEHINMPYNCRHCGGTYCSDHRLPENHSCPGLETWNDPGGVFDSGFDTGVEHRGGRAGGLLARLGIDTGAGGPLGYFRDNVTYLFLGIAVVVFLLQNLVALRVSPDTWASIFTLSTDHPEYVWTWVISVFAHNGPTHLLFNAIALYFFGPIVERQVGSRKYAVLFLASGMLAGLAQVGLGLATGETVRVLGASGAIMAIMGVLSITAPDLKVLLFFFIPMSIRTLTILFAGFSIFAVASGSVLGSVAHFAHLTGLFVGLWYGTRIKDRVGRGPKQLNVGPGGGGGRRRGPF